MENTFSVLWLSISAKYLLGIVASLKFDLADKRVKHSWETLINRLGPAGDDLLLGLLDHWSHQSSEGASITNKTSSQEPHQTLFRRQLWCTVATRWKDASHDSHIHWTNVVEFLSTPLGYVASLFALKDCGLMSLWGQQWAIFAIILVKSLF